MAKKTSYRQRRKIRRAKKQINTLTQRVSKHERKLEMLEEHKAIIEVSIELRNKMPNLAHVEVTTVNLDDYRKMIDLHIKAVRWPESDSYVRKRGIARVREEVSVKVHPPLKKVVFDADFDVFIVKNKLLLWLYICVIAYGLQTAVEQGLKESSWTAEGLEKEYTRYAVELWVSAGWKHKGRSFRFTSLLTNTFSVADVPVSAEFLEAPFQFMAFEAPPFVSALRDEGEGVFSDSEVAMSDILVGYAPEKDNGNIKTLGIVVTPSHVKAASLTHTAHFDTGLTIQQNIENTCGEEATSLGDESLKKILNFVCNALLYCTSFPDDVQAHNAHKLKKLQKRVKRSGKRQKDATQKLVQARSDTIYLVGKNFRLDDKRMSEELSQEDYKLRARHIVRGHWRNQACGPRHSERKLVFVPPFWRGTGPKGSEKTYVVK